MLYLKRRPRAGSGASAHFGVKEAFAELVIEPPAVFVRNVEFERGLLEGPAVAEDELRKAPLPDTRLEVALKPLSWTVVAPRDVRAVIRVLRTHARTTPGLSLALVRGLGESWRTLVKKTRAEGGSIGGAEALAGPESPSARSDRLPAMANSTVAPGMNQDIPSSAYSHDQHDLMARSHSLGSSGGGGAGQPRLSLPGGRGGGDVGGGGDGGGGAMGGDGGAGGAPGGENGG